jgi:hypothetical protein
LPYKFAFVLQLNFEPFNYSFDLKKQEQKTYIFDRVRKKYIQCTPEEWVRQNIITFLHEQKGCSLSLMSVEKGLQFNGMPKRYDLKVYNAKLELLLLVECKAPKVSLSEEVFIQSLTYAQKERPRLIMLSNGNQHIYYDVKSKLFLEDFELFKS